MIKPTFCVVNERGRLKKYYGSDGSILLHDCIRDEAEVVEMPKPPSVKKRVMTRWLPEPPSQADMETELARYQRWKD